MFSRDEGRVSDELSCPPRSSRRAALTMIATTLTTVDASQRTLARQKTREALPGGGKERVRILSAEPLNAETTLEDLGPDLTPKPQFFVGGNFPRPTRTHHGPGLQLSVS